MANEYEAAARRFNLASARYPQMAAAAERMLNEASDEFDAAQDNLRLFESYPGIPLPQYRDSAQDTSDEGITCQHCGAAAEFARTGSIDGYEITFRRCSISGDGHLTRVYSDGTLVDGVAVRYPAMGTMLDGTMTVTACGPVVRVQVPGPWAELSVADSDRLVAAVGVAQLAAVERSGGSRDMSAGRRRPAGRAAASAEAEDGKVIVWTAAGGRAISVEDADVLVDSIRVAQAGAVAQAAMFGRSVSEL